MIDEIMNSHAFEALVHQSPALAAIARAVDRLDRRDRCQVLNQKPDRVRLGGIDRQGAVRGVARRPLRAANTMAGFSGSKTMDVTSSTVFGKPVVDGCHVTPPSVERKRFGPPNLNTPRSTARVSPTAEGSSEGLAGSIAMLLTRWITPRPSLEWVQVVPPSVLFHKPPPSSVQ